MDTFEQLAFDAARPISSATQIMRAVAGRLAVSMIRSVAYVPQSLLGAVEGILTAGHLWTLAIVLAAWIVGSILGGPIGAAINAILVSYGLWELYHQLSDTWGLLKRWAQTAYSARTDAELDAAAQLFAQALSQGAITIIEAIVTHRVFTRVSGSLSKRAPRPEWLDREYEAARRKLDERRRGQGKTRASDDGKGTAEPTRSRPVVEVVKATAATAALTGLAGPPHEPEFPTIPVVAGVLVVTLVVGAAVAAKSGSHGR